MVLSNVEIHNCDTSHRTLDNHDDTCAIVLMTLCVSATGVYIVETTHGNEDKPSISPKQGRKHDMAINMPKMTVGQTSKRKQYM